MNDAQTILETKIIDSVSEIGQTFISTQNYSNSVNSFGHILLNLHSEFAKRTNDLQNDLNLLLDKKKSIDIQREEFDKSNSLRLSDIDTEIRTLNEQLSFFDDQLNNIDRKSSLIHSERDDLEGVINNLSQQELLIDVNNSKTLHTLDLCSRIDHDLSLLNIEAEECDIQMTQINNQKKIAEQKIRGLELRRQQIVLESGKLEEMRLYLIQRKNNEHAYHNRCRTEDNIKAKYRAELGRSEGLKLELESVRRCRADVERAKRQFEETNSRIMNSREAMVRELFEQKSQKNLIKNEMKGLDEIMLHQENAELKLVADLTIIGDDINQESKLIDEKDLESSHMTFEIQEMKRAEELAQDNYDKMELELKNCKFLIEQNKEEENDLAFRNERLIEDKKSYEERVTTEINAYLKAIFQDTRSKIFNTIEESNTIKETIESTLERIHLLKAELKRVAEQIKRKFTYTASFPEHEMNIFNSQQRKSKLEMEIDILNFKINKIKERLPNKRITIRKMKENIEELVQSCKRKGPPVRPLEKIQMSIIESKEKADFVLESCKSLLEEAKNRSDLFRSFVSKDGLESWSEYINKVYEIQRRKMLVVDLLYNSY